MSNGAVPAVIGKEFSLDPNLLPPGASTKVSISATTDPLVLEAILTDSPFPAGTIELGNISLQAEAGRNLQFKAGQATLGFTAAAGIGLGMGVYADSTRAISALNLPAAPEIDLSLPAAASNRYLLMDWNYVVSGSVSLTHPIGALGSLSASVSGSRSGIYAVLHGFTPETGSHKAIADTITSWRLPRHVGEETDLNLKPRTWLIAEADGTLALKIAAQIGYDFSLARNFRVLDLSSQISAKIDAGLKATFGFSTSGKYLVMLGREGASQEDQKVRLRLFKQATRETDFGIDLTVGVTTKSDFPATINDLVQGIFGVHGQQIVKDLNLLNQWTDPTKDLGDTVARLINSTGLNLLTRTTGIDARTEFAKAKGELLKVVQGWNQLPDRLSATLWKLIGNVSQQEAADFNRALQLLATPNSTASQAALTDLIGKAAFADSPISRWLGSVAQQGLIALTDEVPLVQRLAAQTLEFLNGGVIKKLQEFIAEKLDLQKVLDVATQADFDKLDGWLIKRLADFFDENLQFSNLRPIQVAIHSVLTTAENIYEKVVSNLNGKYKFQFAAAYTNSRQSDALLDVVFDLAQPGVHNILRSVLSDSNFDALLTRQVPGIEINVATLSHTVDRSATAQVHMPMWDFESRHVTDSIAKLTARDEGSMVLLFEVNASNRAAVRARFQSQLSALANLRVSPAGALELAVDDQSVITYDDRQVQSAISFDLLRSRTNAFAGIYLKSVLGSDQTALYDNLKQEIAAATGSGNSLGDCLLSMQLSYSARILNAWLKPRSDMELASATRALSVNLQAAYRDLLCSYYSRNTKALKNLGSSAPLLVWASLPPASSVTLGSDGNLQFHTNDSHVYWDFADRELRAAMVADGRTTNHLRDRLRAVSALLHAAGEDSTAAFYDPSQARKLQQEASGTFGDTLMNSLLFSEAEMVGGAANALHDLRGLLPQLQREPSRAVRRLADFGADFTETFNQRLASIYGDDSLRTLGITLMIAASTVLDPAPQAAPVAMLSIALLKPGHKFSLADYIDGKLPSEAEIAYSKSIPAIPATDPIAPKVAAAGQ